MSNRYKKRKEPEPQTFTGVAGPSLIPPALAFAFGINPAEQCAAVNNTSMISNPTALAPTSFYHQPLAAARREAQCRDVEPIREDLSSQAAAFGPAPSQYLNMPVPGAPGTNQHNPPVYTSVPSFATAQDAVQQQLQATAFQGQQNPAFPPPLSPQALAQALFPLSGTTQQCFQPLMQYPFPTTYDMGAWLKSQAPYSSSFSNSQGVYPVQSSSCSANTAVSDPSGMYTGATAPHGPNLWMAPPMFQPYPSTTSYAPSSMQASGDHSQEPGLVPVKKPRIVWTADLHKRFEHALSVLGPDKAVPKSIMKMMNVEGLTRENVASHLQKYRLRKAAGMEGGESHSATTTGTSPTCSRGVC